MGSMKRAFAAIDGQIPANLRQMTAFCPAQAKNWLAGSKQPRRRALALRASTAIAALLLGQVSAWAAKPANPTALEISRLPSYCLDTEWFAGPKGTPRQSPRAAHWEGLMGYGFWSLHHYCWALVSLDRLQASSLVGQMRNFAVHQIVSEYYYVLNNSPPDFILRPEVLVRMGEAELLRENYGAAYDAYFKARQLKPDYWPAYSQWAAVLIKAKKNNDARKLVEEGLIHSPESTVLQEMLRKLGGDPSKIKARASSPAPAATAASAATPASAPAAASAAVGSPAAPEAASAPSARP